MHYPYTYTDPLELFYGQQDEVPWPTSVCALCPAAAACLVGRPAHACVNGFARSSVHRFTCGKLSNIH